MWHWNGVALHRFSSAHTPGFGPNACIMAGAGELARQGDVRQRRRGSRCNRRRVYGGCGRWPRQAHHCHRDAAAHIGLDNVPGHCYRQPLVPGYLWRPAQACDLRHAPFLLGTFSKHNRSSRASPLRWSYVVSINMIARHVLAFGTSAFLSYMSITCRGRLRNEL